MKDPKVSSLCLGFLVAALVSGLSVPAAAEEQVVVLDPDLSKLSFTLKSTLHTVHGSLAMERAELHVDDETGQASGEVLLDSRKTETGNDSRDRKMHREVLESDRFPEIRFRLERVEGKVPSRGGGDVRMVGTVAIHGDEHEVSFAAHLDRQGEVLSGTARLAIPFVDWGMEDPSVFVMRVAKKVDVLLEVQGTISASGSREPS